MRVISSSSRLSSHPCWFEYSDKIPVGGWVDVQGWETRKQLTYPREVFQILEYFVKAIVVAGGGQLSFRWSFSG